MGLLTDFFLATEEEVQRCSHDLEIEGRPFPRIWCKRIDTLSLERLENILLNTAFNLEAFLKKWEGYHLVRTFDETGPWIHRVPPTLIDALQALSPSRIADVAAEWANTEEFKRDRMPADQLAELLQALIAFIQQADAQQKHLYLWMSL